MSNIKIYQEEIESIEKFIERLEGYGCGKHIQVKKQMVNHIKNLTYKINNLIKEEERKE